MAERPDGKLRPELEAKVRAGETLTEDERKELDGELDFMEVNEIAALLPKEEQEEHDRFDDARDDNLDQITPDDATDDVMDRIDFEDGEHRLR